MAITRASGVLLHITSLPGGYGVGDLGDEAYRFVETLVRTGQTLWQVLPLGPTGYGDSPYQCYSAFAGNPLLVSLDRLVAEGLLEAEELRAGATLPSEAVDFDAANAFHQRLLRTAFERSKRRASADDQRTLAAFREQQSYWLDDYVLFQALKTAHGGVAWTDWEPQARSRQPEALHQWRTKLADEIAYEMFVQHEFFRQWSALKRHANAQGIAIIGDVPIFVAHDSADVWSHQDLFALKSDGRPEAVAGVPPDYFSETGQLWGNPVYRWGKMAANGYAWWVERFRSALDMFDQIRLDHFRGFEAYWSVPGDATVATNGKWVTGPGAEMFLQARKQLGAMPLIAEDLGVITPEVESLRDSLGFPGMRVLQFAFGDDPKAADYQPHNYPKHCVVYTGTHDNDTAVGWFKSGEGEGTTRDAEQIERERRTTLAYTGSDGSEIHWDLIRLALASVAERAVFPLQDLLGLGDEGRMNTPGTAKGNWSWRFRWEQLTPQIEQRLAALTTTFERGPLADAALAEKIARWPNKEDSSQPTVNS